MSWRFLSSWNNLDHHFCSTTQTPTPLQKIFHLSSVLTHNKDEEPVAFNQKCTLLGPTCPGVCLARLIRWQQCLVNLKGGLLQADIQSPPHVDEVLQCLRCVTLRSHCSALTVEISGPKGTLLYSNYSFIQELSLPLPGREWDPDISIK